MAHTLTAPAPPAPHEAVRAASDRLKADGALAGVTRLGGAHVYRQREPLPGREPARYLVVRIPQMPGGLAEGHARAVVVPVQVTTFTKAGTTGDVDGLHAAIHDRVHALLAGFSPALPHGMVGVPFQRRGAPGAVAFDPAIDAHYASALYHVTLNPRI